MPPMRPVPLSSCRLLRCLRRGPQIYTHHTLLRTLAESRDFTTTTVSDLDTAEKSHFYFDTGYALFAKRPSKPFPPPFLSLPSGSFSDPLSTHNRSADRRPLVSGEPIDGVTNGDDAILASQSFIAVGDGVGQWATRERGHAALWSRLLLHYWALEAESGLRQTIENHFSSEEDPLMYLQKAYENTVGATSSPNEWHGTTTACGALLRHRDIENEQVPLLYVTNLGDSQCLVLRPHNSIEQSVIYKTKEQWHWFDCPRQLGTNSPDIPRLDASLDKIEIRENDVVLAMSDGVVDNLWEHEIAAIIIESMQEYEQSPTSWTDPANTGSVMTFAAKKLLKATRAVAEDPYAESPFMERAVEEGLALEGGKLDDISIVAAVCRRTPS